MGQLSPEMVPFAIKMPLGDLAASASDVQGAQVSPHRKMIIQGAKLIDSVGVAASDVNYVLTNIKKLGGNVVASYDSRAAGQGALVQSEGKDMSLSATEADLIVDEGEHLIVEHTKNGTADLTGASIMLYGYWKQTA